MTCCKLSVTFLFLCRLKVQVVISRVCAWCHRLCFDMASFDECIEVLGFDIITISLCVLSLAASSRLQPVEEVCACRAEGQAAHPQTLWTCSHGGSQEGCTDQTSGETLFALFLTGNLKKKKKERNRLITCKGWHQHLAYHICLHTYTYLPLFVYCSIAC